MNEKEITDSITIRRVANGWVLLLGCRGPNEFTHIAPTPADLGEHVAKWAQAQIDPLPMRAPLTPAQKE